MKKTLLSLSFILPAACLVGAAAQNVGIGNTAPSDRLHVTGGKVRLEDTNYPWLSFVNNSTLQGFIGAEGNNMRIGTWPGTNPSGKIFLRTNSIDRFTVDEAGDVGIGVTLPASRLHVKGVMRIESASNTAGASLNLYGGTSELSFIQFYKNLSSPAAMGYLGFSGNGDYSIWSRGSFAYLNNDGLGINNSTPLTRLHISSGQDAGLAGTTNGFVMLGTEAGSNIIIDNNEIMARSNGAAAPLTLQNDGGSVRIGNVAAPAGYLFAVKGKMIGEELKVQLSGSWPDYVFKKDYKLPSFAELRKFIAANNHLPNVPPAAELEQNGMEVGDMQKRMMEKIEELTLYVLQLEDQLKELKKEIQTDKSK
ncbi:MAG: hypothetical protein HZA79_02675 [Sphingobacteriales bacterium]|nr:hypothetical protein [Sphingobacteriales bacterium]